MEISAKQEKGEGHCNAEEEEEAATTHETLSTTGYGQAGEGDDDEGYGESVAESGPPAAGIVVQLGHAAQNDTLADFLKGGRV